jgi:type I restriction enzyme, S subunit
MSITVSEQLPLLAAAPNGIKKLRELILELAVRGKLVAQDAGDEPASELLKRIAAEKKQLVAEGRIKQPKALAEIAEEERPFDLPSGWEWQRFGEVFSLEYGDNLPADKRSNTGEYPVYGSNGVVGTHNRCFVEAPCIVVGRKGSAGALNLCLAEGCCVTDVAYYCIPPSDFSLAYVFKMFHTLDLDSLGKGIKPGLSRNEAYELVIAIPSLAEQHRIVAKVDELMALCDRLEAQQADAESAHAQLVAALLGSLTQASDADDFAVSWQRLSAHFHALFTTEPSIDALKQTLLQLAVMGKLVPQDSSDEPVSELLKWIAAEKKRLVAAGKIKQQKPLAKIADEEKVFALPRGWEWQRFAGVALDVSTGPFGSLIHQSDYVDGGVPLVNPSHMIDGRIAPDFSVSLSPEMAENMTSYRLSAGDMVMARRGEVGRVALVTEVEDGWLCGTGSFVLRFIPEISRSYIWTLFRCNFVRAYLAGAAVGTTMVNLNHGILLKMPIAVPPIAEQHRIVAKLDQLMALCDQLSAAIQRRNQHSRHLADALVDKALSPPSSTCVNVVDMSCYLVDRLVAKPTFGRTTHMKLIYLADTHLGFNFQGNYMREAAGPLDTNIYQVEKQAEANGWYTHTLAPLKSGLEKVTYHPTDALAAKAQQVAEALGDRRQDLDRLIALLGDKKTDDVQIVATLFAVWNDALLDGQSPSDDWIIREVRENWHVEKRRFTAEKLGHWLDWMRENHLVPTGKPPRTQQQVKMFH